MRNLLSSILRFMNFAISAINFSKFVILDTFSHYSVEKICRRIILFFVYRKLFFHISTKSKLVKNSQPDLWQFFKWINYNFFCSCFNPVAAIDVRLLVSLDTLISSCLNSQTKLFVILVKHENVEKYHYIQPSL